MHETQESICEWAYETFGIPDSINPIVEKLMEEVDELGNDTLVYKSDNTESKVAIAFECADIYIMLVQLCNKLGFDLHKVVDEKMEINRMRSWRIHGDGTGKHR